MDSWDDDEYEVPAFGDESTPSAVTWEDEEDEEVQSEEPKQVEKKPVDPKTMKPKQLKKLKMKELEEKRRMNQAVAKMRAEEQADETPAERRAREQAAIEEADYENALDAFGAAPVKTAAGGAVEDMETAMANLKLTSLSEHEKCGDLLGERLATSNAKYALEFLKSVVTKGSANLTADHMKELNTVINVIKNDKIQAAKPKSKKKKQTGKQGYAKVERGGGSNAAAGYDDYHDEFDDFM